MDAAIEKVKAEKITVHTVFVGDDRGARGSRAAVRRRRPPGASRPTRRALPSSRGPTRPSSAGSPLRPEAHSAIVAPGKTDLDGVARAIDLAARDPLSETVATNLEERFQIPLAVAVAAAALLLVGLPRARRGAMAGALALAAIALCGTARAQESPAPMPSPAPLPRLERLLGSPRGEAKLGRKAMEEKRWDDAAAHFRRETELSPNDPDWSVQPRVGALPCGEDSRGARRPRHAAEEPRGRRGRRRLVQRRGCALPRGRL